MQNEDFNRPNNKLFHDDCPGNCKGCVYFDECEMPYKAKFASSKDCLWILDGQTFILANDATKSVYIMDDPAEMRGLSPAHVSPDSQPCGTPSKLIAKEVIEYAQKFGECSFNWLHKELNGQLHIPMRILLKRIESKDRNLLIAQGTLTPSLVEQSNKQIRFIVEQLEELLILVNIQLQSNKHIEKSYFDHFYIVFIRILRRANESNVIHTDNVEYAAQTVCRMLSNIINLEKASANLIIAFWESVERILALPDGELSASPTFYKLLNSMIVQRLKH